MAEILTLNSINKEYGTSVKTQVLFDVSLGFEEEGFHAIIGQSGSGKSTLMNIMGTLDRPTSGEVIIDGSPTHRMRPRELARLRNEKIGFVFQFHYLLPEFTAMENVLMPHLIRYGTADRGIRDRAEELMELVGLTQVRNNLATQMSGGQQQRTAIARALIMNPRIVLADEPTGNLDSDSTASVYRTLRDINRTYHTTFILITHDRKIAEQADRIVEIRDGRVELDVRHVERTDADA